MTEPLLSVEGVTAGYGEAVIVRDVALAARPGEIVALLGPNGAGKTTLLRAIAGLVPLRAGAIRLAGARLDGLPPYRIAGLGVATVPEGRRLFPDLSVRENLELGAWPAAARGAAAQTLARVEALFPVLAERRDRPAAVLSGGEQQMAAIGRGLMARPRLLLLDDPFLGLARPVVAAVGRVLRELAREGLTLLAAGQHVRRLLGLADRAYLLDQGRVLVEGPAAELAVHPELRRRLLPWSAEPPG
jgi:branched-chain amino acid transport system ATP-binding protein